MSGNVYDALAELEALFERVIAKARDADTDARPLTYSTDEAAKALGVGSDLVRRWVNRGVLPRLPDTRDIRVPRQAVEAFVAEAAVRKQVHS